MLDWCLWRAALCEDCEEAEETESSEDAGAQATDETSRDIKSFDIKLHSAELSRSFAKIGWMAPYAIVVLGDSRVEAGRTPAAKHAHKKPVWNSDLHINVKHVPDSITIAVWDKNNFHRDVFCGSTTVPCAQDMGTLSQKTFTLTKKDKPTGSIKLTISVQFEDSSDAVIASKSGLGPELDVISSWADTSGAAHGAAISFRQGEDWAAQGCKAHGEPPSAEEHEGEKEGGADVPATAEVPTSTPTAAGTPCAPLLGKWKCVDTWGLDDFLKAQKRSFFERKTAGAARWPDWEFKLSGDKVIFLNSTMIGLLTEEIPLGEEYENVDGQKNVWSVMATWTPAGASGGSLVQDRKGRKELGEVREERTVAGDKLEFKLTKEGTSWGRSFVRV